MKEYLKYYIGCECQYPDVNEKLTRATLTGFSQLEGAETTYKRKRKGIKGDYIPFINLYSPCCIDNIKLLLRPLSSMTEEEFDEFSRLTMYHPQFDVYGVEAMVDEILTSSNPETFVFALSKGFDLFNLLEKGFAIDKTKL